MDALSTARGPRTLVVDIGGTGTKCIVADTDGAALTGRTRLLTPNPATPAAVLGALDELVGLQSLPFERVSVGFPGVVRRGIVFTAPNLGSAYWAGHDLGASVAELTGRPARVLNDAELQGFGVIEGRGVEVVLTLGTGLGAALYTDGHLVPNLELGHHPFEKRRTYEERVCDAERRRIGRPKWRKRVLRALALVEVVFNPDRIHLGGGSVKHLDASRLPSIVRTFGNVQAMAGGVRLWGPWGSSAPRSMGDFGTPGRDGGRSSTRHKLS